MCGRYANHVTQMGQWQNRLREWPQDVATGFNIAPTQIIPAFRATQGEGMRWGLIPHWSKAPSSKYSTFNARIEGIDGKPTFRDAWRRGQRCLIPALGYYEWRQEAGGKQPYFVQREDGEPMVFGGLWDSWGPEGLLSCTIITRDAEASLASLHPRRPLMIAPEDAPHWLTANPQNLRAIIEQDLSEQLQILKVSRAVNDAHHQGPELIEPIGFAP